MRSINRAEDPVHVLAKLGRDVKVPEILPQILDAGSNLGYVSTPSPHRLVTRACDCRILSSGLPEFPNDSPTMLTKGTSCPSALSLPLSVRNRSEVSFLALVSIS